MFIRTHPRRVTKGVLWSVPGQSNDNAYGWSCWHLGNCTNEKYEMLRTAQDVDSDSVSIAKSRYSPAQHRHR